MLIQLSNGDNIKLQWSHKRKSEAYFKAGYDDKRNEPFNYYKIHRFKTRGGKTTCKIIFSDNLYVVGNTRCSNKDNYCYATGRLLSLKNALKTNGAVADIANELWTLFLLYSGKHARKTFDKLEDKILVL